jgi:F420-non-reducing hydrogenase iron-sulfur subunit
MESLRSVIFVIVFFKKAKLFAKIYLCGLVSWWRKCFTTKCCKSAQKKQGTKVPKGEKMTDFEPKIVAFLCNWCAYAGADLAGVSRLQYPSNLRTIRVMCSGRVDPVFIIGAFKEGCRRRAGGRLTHR